MRVFGISNVVSNKNPEAISSLYQRFNSENIADKILSKISNEVIFVYTRYQGDFTEPYTLVIGHEVQEDDTSPPNGLDHIQIQDTNHTRYRLVDQTPNSVFQKWSEIWAITEKKRAYIADYDRYCNDGSVEICVEFLRDCP